MAIKYGFFNSVNGDRKYTAADIGDFLQGLIASGVYHDSSTSLQVLATGGMTVEVQPGRAMLNFKKLENDSPHGLTLTAGGTMDRIDAIVAYMDLNERACGIIVREGTPAVAPVAPAMTRTDVRYEVMLASVYVTRLTNEITQAKITDTRANTAVCGWVHGIIDQVDTAALFVQWQTAYEEAYAELGDYLAAQKAAWEKFFTDVSTDSVFPAPSLDDAAKIPTVNAAGNGYELHPTDTTLNLAGRAADAAATGKAVRAACPVNMLDNSDFTKPVNQRGKTIYTSAGYTIDRWTNNSSNLKTELIDGGIRITNSDNTLRYPAQWHESGTIKPGKKYTAAFYFVDGSISVQTATAEQEAMTTGAWEKNVCLFLHPSANGDRFGILVSGGATVDIAKMAVYEGEYTADTLPEYRPKGYAAELQECRRYYRQSWHGAVEDMTVSGSVPFIRSAGGANTQMAINWHDPMRITPTIKIYSPATKAENYIRDWVGSADKPVGGAGYVSPYGFCLVLKDSGTTAGTDYVFHYTASADM